MDWRVPFIGLGLRSEVTKSCKGCEGWSPRSRNSEHMRQRCPCRGRVWVSARRWGIGVIFTKLVAVQRTEIDKPCSFLCWLEKCSGTKSGQHTGRGDGLGIRRWWHFFLHIGSMWCHQELSGYWCGRWLRRWGWRCVEKRRNGVKVKCNSKYARVTLERGACVIRSYSWVIVGLRLSDVKTVTADFGAEI